MSQSAEEKIQNITATDLRLLEQLLHERPGKWDQSFEELLKDSRIAAIARIQMMLPDVDASTVQNLVSKFFQKFTNENRPK